MLTQSQYCKGFQQFEMKENIFCFHFFEENTKGKNVRTFCPMADYLAENLTILDFRF